MSTTVKYKGNTITTISNETKKLTTKGTWLEDDIEIKDVSSGGSQSLIVDTPDVNGGTIREITTDTVVMLEEAKTVTPSSTQQIITPSQGYDGFSSVVVGAGLTWNSYFSKNTYAQTNITYDGTSISRASLYGQKNIVNISFPNVTTLRDSDMYYRFANMPNLESFSAPKATYVDDYFLKGCSNLLIVDFKSLRDSATSLLEGTKVEVLILPSIQTIYSRMCFGNTYLRVLDALVSNGFTNQNNFNGCTSFNTLIIRKNNGVASCSNINNFTNTPFASDGTGGILYVPQALISSYESATNWSTILGYEKNQILPIEGSIYETQYADGTSINS